MKKTKRLVKKPSIFYWYFIGAFAILWFRFHVKYRLNGDTKIRKRSLLIAPHRSYFDLFSLPLAAYPKRGHVVSTSYWFRNKKLGKLLRALGCIKKDQYKSDVRSIKEMVDCLNHDEIVYLFPEGQMSIDGRSQNLVTGLDKFIKRFHPNVYFVNTNGAYLASPKWHQKLLKKAEIEADVKLLIKEEDIENLSIAEINNLLQDSFKKNYDFDWVKANPGHIYYDKNKAEGLYQVLPFCPKCLMEGTISSSQSEVNCSCGFHLEFERDSYDFKENPFFHDLGNLLDFEREEMEKYVKEGKTLTDEAKIIYYTANESYDTTYKSVKMDREKIYFISETETFSILLSQVINFVITLNKSFEVPTSEKTYRIYTKDGRRAILYRMYLDAVKKENK